MNNEFESSYEFEDTYYIPLEWCEEYEDELTNTKTEKDDINIDLLPHQMEFMSDTHSKILGIVSGYGGGKTFIAARKLLHLASLNPGTDLIATEPNFPLLIQILIPEIHAALKQFKLEYLFKATEQTFYVKIDGLTTRLICKSLENYDRLIGINASGIILDEFDTTKPEVAHTAFLKLLGRLRAGHTRQLCIISTPEGYGAMYKIFIEEERGRLLKARTTDNIYLPEDFINTLYSIYPENLVKAYINGEFVNMKSSTVFPYFDRQKHDGQPPSEDNDMYLGGDFNVGGSVTLCAYQINNIIYVIEENISKDTFHTAEYLNRRFPRKRLYGSFDATGSRKTSNASQSDLDILNDAGVSLIMGKKNPHMQDSILSVNNALRHNELIIDTKKCPNLTKALEQLSYDEITGNPEKFAGPGTIDDFTDALRYLVWALKPVTKVTFSTYNNMGTQVSVCRH